MPGVPLTADVTTIIGLFGSGTQKRRSRMSALVPRLLAKQT